MYLAPISILWPVPNVLLFKSFPFGCCITNCNFPDGLSTVYSDLSILIVPGIVDHSSFGPTLGSSHDHSYCGCNHLGCSRLFYGPDHNNRTGYHVLVCVDPLAGTILLLVVRWFEVQSFRLVPPIGLVMLSDKLNIGCVICRVT